MCITEYDEQMFVNGIKEEAREEGIDIGEKKMIFKYVSSGRIFFRKAQRMLECLLTNSKRL